MSFPPGSVESTPPLLLKRRKYTKVDVQPVDGWRLVMSLRSGLLMESSWALDVINVLLYDDHSFTYFGLGNMPGLLEALLEHWRATLISMFEITEDLELGTDQDRKLRAKRRLAIMGEKYTKKRKCSRKIKEESDKEDSLFAKSDSENEEEDNATDDYGLGMVSNNLTNPEDKCVVLSSLPNGQNFSKRPRFGEEDIEVISKPDELFIMEREQEKEENNCSWDLSTVDCGSGSSHWLHGGGNPTDHIITSFTAKHTISEFVRVLKESKHLVKLEVAEDSVNGDVSIKPSVNGDSIDPSECKKESNTDEIKPDRSENNANGTNQDPKEDIVDKIQRLTGIVFRDPDAARKRWHSESLEDENYMKDEPSLHLISDCHDNIGKRAVCISTILRNLSFVPGNEYELSKSPGFLAIVGRLLLLHYWYPQRTNKQRNYDRGEDEEAAESCTSLSDSNNEWWWSHLHVIRENIMVALANIAGSLDLSPFDEDICRPILNGLLEWAVSSSAYAQDPFPNVGRHSPISPQRLAIEALCKLSLSEFNVDLILSTPPYTRIEKLTLMLAKKLYRYEDQVLREFSINLLYYLSSADSGVARTIALSDMTVALLLGFIEQAEQNAMVVAQQHGVNALRDNPDSMGTSLDMLRRAASTLGNLSKHPDNVPLFLRQEQRLLALVMSQILDQGVASILSNVLFNIGSSNSSDRTTYFGPKKEPQISTTKKQNEEKLKQEVAKPSEGSITAANA
jgi:AT-rich interactive domain-containing protein 1